MKYLKPIMKMSELKRMGMTETFLKKAAMNKEGKIAWRTDKENRNSALMFDTEELEKYRLKEIELEKKYKIRQGVC